MEVLVGYYLIESTEEGNGVPTRKDPPPVRHKARVYPHCNFSDQKCCLLGSLALDRRELLRSTAGQG